MDWIVLGKQIALSVVFTLVGLALLGGTFWLLTKVIPFSIRKEIEEDQNTALAVVLAAVILGVSLIVAAAVVG